MQSAFGLILAAQVVSGEYQSKELEHALFDTEERLIMVEQLLTSENWTNGSLNIKKSLCSCAFQFTY